MLNHPEFLMLLLALAGLPVAERLSTLRPKPSKSIASPPKMTKEERGLDKIKTAYVLGSITVEEMEHSTTHVLLGGTVDDHGKPLRVMLGESPFSEPEMETILKP